MGLVTAGWSGELVAMAGPCEKGNGCPVDGHCAAVYGALLSGPLNVDSNGKPSGVVELPYAAR